MVWVAIFFYLIVFGFICLDILVACVLFIDFITLIQMICLCFIYIKSYDCNWIVFGLNQWIWSFLEKKNHFYRPDAITYHCHVIWSPHCRLKTVTMQRLFLAFLIRIKLATHILCFTYRMLITWNQRTKSKLQMRYTSVGYLGMLFFLLFWVLGILSFSHHTPFLLLHVAILVYFCVTCAIYRYLRTSSACYQIAQYCNISYICLYNCICL